MYFIYYSLIFTIIIKLTKQSSEILHGTTLRISE